MTPPTEAEIKKVAANYSLPQKSELETLVAKVFEQRISSDFYTSAGTHGPNAHQSLTREHWEEDISLGPRNSFKAMAGEPGYQELYFLFLEGEQDRKGACARQFVAPSFPILRPTIPGSRQPAIERKLPSAT